MNLQNSFLSALVGCFVLTVPGRAAAGLTVDHLRCEGRVRPLGVDEEVPRFSWTLSSGERDQVQSAYQVVVEGVWDSGKVTSGRTHLVEYGGPPLAAGTPYHWRVRVWDGDGEVSPYSGTATFSTALAGWSASWIGLEEPAATEFFGTGKWIWYPAGNPAAGAPVGVRHFRREVVLAAAPERAGITVAADNAYEVTVNGVPAGTGDNFKHPGEFDITGLMRAGANVVEVKATNAGAAANPAGLIVRLRGTESGVPFEVVSDATWSASQDGISWVPALAMGSYGSAPWGVMETRVLPARYLRKEFATEPGKEVTRATAYVCGLGFFDFFLNGGEVSDHVMDPALSDYKDTVYYVTFDVTEQIAAGANSVGVILGNGRFMAPRSTSPAITETFGFPQFLGQIEIEYSDGTRQTVASDSSWRVTDRGPIRANNEYDGETYDSRLEMDGWSEAGFDDSAWQAVDLPPAPAGGLRSQPIEPMRVTRVIQPVSVTTPVPGTHVVDMGEAFYGTVRIKASAPRGTTVRMTGAYSLLPDGTLKTADNRDAECTDVYTFKGQGVEEWTPRFKGQGFRRVQVTGFPGTLTVANFEGLMIHTDVEEVGSFACSDDLINRIHAAATRGARMFLRSAPLDPDRDERQAWMGDPAKGAEAEAYNFNVAPFYTKWMDDVADSQRADGTIPDVAMYWDWGQGVEWPAVFTIIPDWFVDFYGDDRVAETHYGAMKKWVLAMRMHEEPDGTLRGTSYGDWVDVSTIESGGNNGSTPGNLVSSAYQYHNYRIMQRLAARQGKAADEAMFAKLGDDLKTAFNGRFFNPADHSYAGDTQCAYVLALKFGLVPEVHRQSVVNRLADNIMLRNKGHLSVGLVGMQWLMQTLTEIGRSDLAWTIATRTDRPSWGYMIGQGATTIWERWDGDTRDGAMNSESLLILAGNLDSWFYQTLAGIRPVSEGFRTFRIQPETPGDLTWAGADFMSPAGRISSRWEFTSPTSLTLSCEVPPNASAVLHFPLTRLKDATISEGGVKIWTPGGFVGGAAGIAFDGAGDTEVRFRLGSGKYEFSATGTAVAASVPPVIVDNDDAAAVGTGSWVRNVDSETDQRYGRGFSYAAAGSGNARYEFRPELPAAGDYRVYVMWTSHANRASNAPFTVHHTGGESLVRVNQEAGGGVWNLLGTYRFDRGTGGRVVLTNDANEYVIADAVKFEPASPGADGLESLLEESFDTTSPGNDSSFEIASRQRGFLAPVRWQKNGPDAEGESVVGHTGGGSGGEGGGKTLLLSPGPGDRTGERLLANLAPATRGTLVLKMKARARDGSGGGERWFALAFSSAPFGSDPWVMSPGNAFGLQFRADGQGRVIVNGADQGDVGGPWTGDAGVAEEIALELTDTAGSGSPFAGNGTRVHVYGSGGTLLRSFSVPPMTGCHLHVGSSGSAWEIDDLTIGTGAGADAFAGWIGSHFPGETDPAIVGLHADPDRDGIDNAAECVILGDPGSVSATGIRAPVSTVTDFGVSLALLQGGVQTRNENGSVTLRYPALGVSLTISGSRDLRTWSEWISGGLESGAAPGPGFPDLGGTAWSYRRWSLGKTGSKGFLRMDFE